MNNNILYLSRHSTPDIDLKICYGQTDIDVKETFYNEAYILANKIEKLNITTIYTSPLIRCLKLAEYIQQNTKCNIIEDERIKEMNFGKWELTPWNEIPLDDLNKWAKDPFGFKAPQGECFNDVIERVISFYREKNCKSTHLIVTHAGVIKAFFVYLLKMEPQKALNYELPFACLCKIDLSNKKIQIIE